MDLRELRQRYLDTYEYKDGKLYYKIKPNFRIKVGSLVGCKDSASGYWRTKVDGKKQSIHRIIFLMFRGYLPNLIDHIDRNVDNNCIENLRKSDPSHNQLNTKLRKDNELGTKNVHLNVWGTYIVKFQVRGIKYQYSAQTLREAILIRDTKRSLHGA